MGEQLWTHAKLNFFRSRLEVSLLGKLGQKNKNSQFDVKFAPKLIGICRMMMFTFFVLCYGYLFWASFVQKIKIVSLS